MRKTLMLAAFAIATMLAAPAVGQLNNPGATTAQLVSAQAAAQAAADAAVAAKAAADSKCNPMAAIPRAEVVGGSAGSGANCQLVNAAIPRISRTDTFVVAGSTGMLTVTWPTPLPTTTSSGTPYTSYPVSLMPIGAAGAAPNKWKVISSSNTGFTAQCSQELTTLNFTLSALTAAALTGLQLPLNTWCAAGTQVFALQLPSAN